MKEYPIMIDINNCSPYQLLSTTEVAAVLGLSKGAVRKLARNGRLRTIDGFRILYFSAQAVRDFAAGAGV
ncbi:hypothetical protein ACM41_23005 [Bradyrhizobium sp. CCBAU 21362]|jgi:excisionase family DNA binding protein|nr:hypothetical protein [Bradyrhizobium sp. CCBAU 21362]